MSCITRVSTRVLAAAAFSVLLSVVTAHAQEVEPSAGTRLSMLPLERRALPIGDDGQEMEVVYDGELLDKLNDSVVDDYINSMEKLLQLKTDEVRPGHYHSFDRRRLQELVTQYIDDKKAPICPSEK